jgi:hypothetical protein
VRPAHRGIHAGLPADAARRVRGPAVVSRPASRCRPAATGGTAVDCLPAPVTRRDVAPRRAGPRPPPDPVDQLPALPGRPASPRRTRQRRLQVSPLLITQVTTAHASIIPASPHQDRLLKHGLGGDQPARPGRCPGRRARGMSPIRISGSSRTHGRRASLPPSCWDAPVLTEPRNRVCQVELKARKAGPSFSWPTRIAPAHHRAPSGCSRLAVTIPACGPSVLAAAVARCG